MNDFLTIAKQIAAIANEHCSFVLSKKDSDGRVNSKENENEVKQELFRKREFFEEIGIYIRDSGDRKLADILVDYPELAIYSYPINIKVTSEKPASNNMAGSKTLMNFIFFGENKSSSTEVLCKRLIERRFFFNRGRLRILRSYQRIWSVFWLYYANS